MHAEAFAFVATTVQRLGRPFARVVEIGGRDINGTVRPLFGDAEYLGLDLHAGPGVDVVADVRDWRPKHKADAVVCCEVLEHAPDPEGIVTAAADILKKGGLLILTAATDPRAPHSGLDGAAVREGEHYQNVPVAALERWLSASFASHEVQVHRDRGDVYAVARK